MRVRPTSRRRIALCTALVLAVYAGGIDAALRADLSAVEILERAATAPERTNYKGQQATTIYYTPEPRYLVANLVHMKPFTTKVEMMLPAETAGRTMLFTENELRQYEPAGQQLIISTIPGREIQRGEVGDLDLLRRNYEIRLVGTDRFLDRKTYNISLDPKFPGSSSRKLSIDTQTFVTLKSEEYSTGPERKLRVATYFASISFPKSISSSEVSLDVPKGVKVCRVVVPSRCASVWLVPLDFKPALPVVIPGGFAFKNAGLSVGKGKTLHLNFTNGDSKVSLFEAKRGSAGAAAASPEQDGPQRLVVERGRSELCPDRGRGFQRVEGVQEMDQSRKGA
jgi:outer membrane lipoprotein-sorting protein